MMTTTVDGRSNEMRLSLLLKVVLFFLTMHLAAMLARGAEKGTITLRESCTPASTIVTLADVAEVSGVNLQRVRQLERLELFTCPIDRQKTLQVTELQELLTLYGINPVNYNFMGAGHVTVFRDNGEPLVLL